jgi:lysozyme family protein
MNYTPEFNESFNRLIDVEKGLSNDPNDPGNWTGGRVGAGILKGTKYGISAATYPHINIADLTVDDAKAIYWNDWWIAIAAGDLHPAIVYSTPSCWSTTRTSARGTATARAGRGVLRSSCDTP